MTWETFIEYCTLQSGPPLQNNPSGELVHLKKTGSVKKYQQQFQRLKEEERSINSKSWDKKKGPKKLVFKEEGSIDGMMAKLSTLDNLKGFDGLD